jgi:hypothetical protein
VIWSSCRCRLGYTAHLGSGNAARLALAVVVVAPMLAALRTVVAGSCGRVRSHVSGGYHIFSAKLDGCIKPLIVPSAG